MVLLLFFLPLWFTGAELELTDGEWRKKLGHERYNVMRRKATEPGYSGTYLDEERAGTYLCAACDLELFRSQDKYSEPGCGWPLFKQPIQSQNVIYKEDWSMSFKRYEVLCRKCESHLGHVFNDGPPPKHRRYIINSIALVLRFKNS